MSTGGSGTWVASDGAEAEIYRAEPEGTEKVPALVIFPSIFGMTDELREHADAIADTGALAVAFDPFCRVAPGGLGEDESERAMRRLGKLDLERANADYRELITSARDDRRCNGKVVGLGICLGGPFVIWAAAEKLIDAGACWHGSRIGNLLDRADDIRCPLSLDFGDADPVVPMEEVDRIREAFAGKDNVDIRVHPGATHGFSHTGWRPYDEAAARAGRAAVETLLSALS